MSRGELLLTKHSVAVHRGYFGWSGTADTTVETAVDCTISEKTLARYEERGVATGEHNVPCKLPSGVDIQLGDVLVESGGGIYAVTSIPVLIQSLVLDPFIRCVLTRILAPGATLLGAYSFTVTRSGEDEYGYDAEPTVVATAVRGDIKSNSESVTVTRRDFSLYSVLQCNALLDPAADIRTGDVLTDVARNQAWLVERVAPLPWGPEGQLVKPAVLNAIGG